MSTRSASAFRENRGYATIAVTRQIDVYAARRSNVDAARGSTFARWSVCESSGAMDGGSDERSSRGFPWTEKPERIRERECRPEAQGRTHAKPRRLRSVNVETPKRLRSVRMSTRSAGSNSRETEASPERERRPEARGRTHAKPRRLRSVNVDPKLRDYSSAPTMRRRGSDVPCGAQARSSHRL